MLAKQGFELFFGHPFQSAFPDCCYSPPELSQFPSICSVSFRIAFQLGKPIFEIGTGNAKAFAFVFMPETTIDQEDCLVFWQNDIWLAR